MINNPQFMGPPQRRPINGSSQRRAIDRIVAAVEPLAAPDASAARQEQKAAVSAWEDEGGSLAAPKGTQRR